VLVRALLAQTPQRFFKLIQIIPVLATRPTALHNLLRQGLWVLRTEELRIVRQADVHEALDWIWQLGGVEGNVWGGRYDLVGCGHVLWGLFFLRIRVDLEGRVLDAVPVDFADVQVFLHFGDVLGGNAVGCAPDSGWGRGVLLRGEVIELERQFLSFCVQSCMVAYLISQGFPELAVDQRHDATWIFACTAVVLAVLVDCCQCFGLGS
jgi:hypothetical protein